MRLQIFFAFMIGLSKSPAPRHPQNRRSKLPIPAAWFWWAIGSSRSSTTI